MAVEAVRLASFDRWPRSSPVIPENLARAGFYYTGNDNKPHGSAVTASLNVGNDHLFKREAIVT